MQQRTLPLTSEKVYLTSGVWGGRDLFFKLEIQQIRQLFQEHLLSVLRI